MQTLLPLETLRRLTGFSPWHFWQLANSEKMPINAACNTLLRKYAWQYADSVGRTDIEEAIRAAESLLIDHLGYSPLSRYVTKTLDLGGCWQHNSLARSSGAIPWFGGQGFYTAFAGTGNQWRNTVELGEGYIEQIGITALNLLSTLTLTFLDRDNDGLNETWTALYSDNGAITDLTTLEVYFSQSDWLDWESVDLEDYRVRPVLVTRQDADMIKITGPAWLVVRPTLYELPVINGYDPGINGLATNGAIDPTKPQNFVTTMTLYQRGVANPNQATLAYVQAGQTTASYPVNLTVVDATAGLVAFQPNGCAAPCTCGGPTVSQLQVSYRAGASQAKTGQREWELTINRLALAELMRPIGVCEEANREVYRWQVDLARAGGTLEEQFRIDPGLLANPIGTRAGHVYAWQRVRQLRNQPGIAV